MGNRRIGERFPPDDNDLSELAWVPLGWRRWLRKPDEMALLVELSITGASVLAAPGRVVGERVHVKVRSGGGVVEVRNVAKTSNPALCRYGVCFVALDDVLTGIVSDTVAAHQPERKWGWTFVD